jgi:hypothetical protein
MSGFSAYAGWEAVSNDGQRIMGAQIVDLSEDAGITRNGENEMMQGRMCCSSCRAL